MNTDFENSYKMICRTLRFGIVLKTLNYLKRAFKKNYFKNLPLKPSCKLYKFFNLYFNIEKY